MLTERPSEICQTFSVRYEHLCKTKRKCTLEPFWKAYEVCTRVKRFRSRWITPSSPLHLHYLTYETVIRLQDMLFWTQIFKDVQNQNQFVLMEDAGVHAGENQDFRQETGNHMHVIRLKLSTHTCVVSTHRIDIL